MCCLQLDTLVCEEKSIVLLTETLPIVIHSHIVILHCSVFDAAMNGKSQALLTLLLLVQFAEMKASAMKKISEANLGSLCYEGLNETKFHFCLTVAPSQISLRDFN